jgi:glycosyltransferase involved in cell wall biosynthesis
MKLGVVVDGPMRGAGALLAEWGKRFDVEFFAPEGVAFPVKTDRQCTPGLRRELRAFLARNDMVFFDWSARLLVEATRMRVRTRIVAQLRSHEIYTYAADVRWKRVDRIVFVSEAMRNRFVVLFPNEAAKTRVVNIGKDLARYDGPRPPFAGRIGMLCEIVPIKRVYEVILALAELRNRGYSLSLHIGGVAREGHEYRRYGASIASAVTKLSLDEHVVFHGWVDDVPSWLREVDIFVSNSFWEGQQNALIEAMASGCFCLSHFWDGADEVLPADYLYATDSEMQRKIADYCDLPDDDKARHRTIYRPILETRFGVQLMCDRLCEVILEAARKIPGPRGVARDRRSAG